MHRSAIIAHMHGAASRVAHPSSQCGPGRSKGAAGLSVSAGATRIITFIWTV